MQKKLVITGAMAVIGLAAVACSIAELEDQVAGNTASKDRQDNVLSEEVVPAPANGQLPPLTDEMAEPVSRAEAALAPLSAEIDVPQTIAPLSSMKQRAMVGTVIDHQPPLYRPLPSDDRERYQNIDANPVKLVSDEPVSTFSIDVDTAAYANVRRFLKDGMLPPIDAVRIEELINYFDYAYAKPEAPHQPFNADIALFDSPWDSGSQLLRIGLKGYSIEEAKRPPANLVFLVDTSGSMNSPDKLPLLKRSFRMLVNQMSADDRIAIVTYAGSAGVILKPTSGKDKSEILHAIDHFEAGGSTAGADGIREAYRLAEATFDEEAINRVILATDGDFNVGLSDPGRLEDYIAGKRKNGVYLSILGFGRGNLNDLLMQKLAQAGNGNASYIDSLMEAHKVLVDEIGSTLFPIANDVKIQIEFNPNEVAEYRLIGYETRMLAREDFNNDKVDAGEIGSGHTVTALYEITAPDSPSRLVDDQRYGILKAAASDDPHEGELAWLRLRYKQPGEDESLLLEQPITTSSRTGFDQAPDEARFAAAVAGFGQILKQDPNVEDLDFETVHRIARDARGEDAFGYRSEFLQLIKLAESAEAMQPLN
ncbi:MAG: vWA domain-containing protein [Geminicoccales bacterium]